MEAFARFCSCVSLAEAITMDDGPVLTSWDFFPDSEEDEVVLCLSWTDGENDFYANFRREAIDEVVFSNNSAALKDTDGQECIIKFFKMTPINPMEIK